MPPRKRKLTKSTLKEEKRNTKTKTICSCCDAEGKQASGCSCRGGGKRSSHQCRKCLELPLPLTTETSVTLTEALNPYFNEIKLAEIVYGYLGKRNTFIFTWQIDSADYAPLLNESYSKKAKKFSITLPLEPANPLDFWIQWGDGTANHITSYDQKETTHVYPKDGDYIVHIDGAISGFAFGNGHNRWANNILDISQWGCVGLGTHGYQFHECQSLNISAVDTPELSKVTNMSHMFYNTSLEDEDLSQWDTSNVTNMEYMFYRTEFNGDISKWDTRNVVKMQFMFAYNTAFNGDISGWDINNVINMNGMFQYASDFEGDLSRWNTSNLTNMNSMFQHAALFNSDISGWHTSNVTHMSYTFQMAKNFNCDLSGWITSKVKYMKSTFHGASSFNRDCTDDWDLESIEHDYRAMFRKP